MLENPKELRKTVRSHITIYVLVLFLTGSSIAIHFMGLEPRHAAVLYFAIAGIQVFLISQFLMHLVSEDRPIYGLVAFTVLALAGLIIFSIATDRDTYEGAVRSSIYSAQPAAQEY